MNAPITHISCLGIIFPITHTSATQKDLFPNYLCNHFGPHSKSFTSQLGNFPRNYCYLNFRDVNFLGPFSCIQRCAPAKLSVLRLTLEEPKHKKRTPSQQISFFRDIQFQNASTKIQIFYISHLNFKIKCFRNQY